MHNIKQILAWPFIVSPIVIDTCLSPLKSSPLPSLFSFWYFRWYKLWFLSSSHKPANPGSSVRVFDILICNCIWSRKTYLTPTVLQSKDHVFRGHADSVDQLCWHPTHPDLVATAAGDKTVRIWDARSCKPVATIATKGEIYLPGFYLFHYVNYFLECNHDCNHKQSYM